MKAYGVIAAALAAFAIGTLHITPSLACTEGRCAEKTATAVGKPLQLTKQKSSARTAVKDSRRKKRSRIKAAPVEEKTTVEQTNQSHTPAVSDTHDDPPLPVVVVRTTRESGDEQSAPVLSEEEFNDLDRAAASQSLLTSTIANYLGRPDITDDFENAPDLSAEDFSSEAKVSFAAAPEPQKPAQIAIEYILMTFGGALAAASAIRLFVV